MIRASFLHADSIDESKLSLSKHSNASSDELVSDNFPSDDIVGESSPTKRGSRAARLPSKSTLNLTTGMGEGSPSDLAAEVALGVKDQFRQMLPENLLIEYNFRDCMAPFQTSEIVIGRKLGSGEFSHVFEIRCFEKDEAIEADLDNDQRETRNYMKNREKYRDTGKS
eukprot:scaffold25347_cov86-Skeletonema_dohrnii-CCMP3373.AAC.5